MKIWISFFIIVIIVLSIICAIFYVSGVIIRNSKTQWFRNFVAHAICHPEIITTKTLFRPKQYSLEQMPNGVWNEFVVPAYHSGLSIDHVVPVTIYKQPNPEKSSYNWLHLDTSVNTILFFQGGGSSCNTTFGELFVLSKYLNYNIICIEYPGCGKRERYSKPTEENLQQFYPKEVKYILNEILHINLNKTIIWMACFGSFIGLNCLKEIWKNQNEPILPAALYFTKPYTSIKSLVKKSTHGYFGIYNLVPSNLLSIIPDSLGLFDDVFKITTCPVFASICEHDKVVCNEDATHLVDCFYNSKRKQIKVLKNIGHVIDYISFFSIEIGQDIPQFKKLK